MIAYQSNVGHKRINTVSCILKTTVIYFLIVLTTKSCLAQNVNINIKGEILTPSCQINGGKPIEVVFNNISVFDISNISNHKKITVPIQCDYSITGLAAYVKITGIVLERNNILASNINGFGIALYQGVGTEKELNIGEGVNNQGYKISNGLSGSNFTFTATPFFKGNQLLTGGSFSASANMSILYF